MIKGLTACIPVRVLWPDENRPTCPDPDLNIVIHRVEKPINFFSSKRGVTGMTWRNAYGCTLMLSNAFQNGACYEARSR